MNLKPETLQRIDEVITHYPMKRSATLPLLHLIQEDSVTFRRRPRVDRGETGDPADQRV